MAKVVVVYHSGYGHTQRVAQALAQGADAQLLAIGADGELSAEDWQALDQADAIVMGSPTYMGSVSWQFKKFADTSSKRWYTRAWKDKLFAGFSCSASMDGDKFSTLHYMFTLAMQHGGVWVGLGLPPSNAKSAQRSDVNYLGSYAGATTQAPSDASAEEISAGDLETARLLGQRVAQAAQRWQA